jgi:hypothetical protein
VEQRQHAQHLVVLVDAVVDLRGGPRLEREVPVGQEDALRGAGRPGGVRLAGDVVVAVADREFVVGEERVELGGALRVAADADDGVGVGLLADRLDLRDEVGQRDDRDGAAVAEQVLDLPGLVWGFIGTTMPPARRTPWNATTNAGRFGR